MSSSNIDHVLNQEAPSGVYRYQSKAQPQTIDDDVAFAHWQFFWLDGNEIYSKSDFLDEAARVLKMPSYVGSNWDAFEEAINDLSWVPTEHGYIILYDDAYKFSHSKEFATAMSILSQAAENWSRAGTPFYVLIRKGSQGAVNIPWWPGR